jgi:hypothetical protein
MAIQWRYVTSLRSRSFDQFPGSACHGSVNVGVLSASASTVTGTRIAYTIVPVMKRQELVLVWLASTGDVSLTAVAPVSDVKTACQVPVACQLAVRLYLAFAHLVAVSVDVKCTRAGPVESLPPHAAVRMSAKKRAPIVLFVMFKFLERKKSRGERCWSFRKYFGVADRTFSMTNPPSNRMSTPPKKRAYLLLIPRVVAWTADPVWRSIGDTSRGGRCGP